MTTRCSDMIQLYFTTPMITVPTGRIVLATKSSQTMHALLSFLFCITIVIITILLLRLLLFLSSYLLKFIGIYYNHDYKNFIIIVVIIFLLL